MTKIRSHQMRLIKLKEVMHKTSLGHSSIYKFIAEGTFPKQISLGAKSVAWLESDIENWIMEKIES